MFFLLFACYTEKTLEDRLDELVVHQREDLCNFVDDDEDGEIDEDQPPQLLYWDGDGDGFGEDSTAASHCLPADNHWVSQGGDCLDSDAMVFPGGSEICNGLDDNCDTLIDDEDPSVDSSTQIEFAPDADQDGFGDRNAVYLACTSTDPTITTDCDDTSADISPLALEICDNIDNNCDGNVDEGIPTITLYEDLDMDNFGSNISLVTCDTLVPVGYSLVSNDCDDNNAAIYPGATEILYNGVDENCDGVDNYLGIQEASLSIVKLWPNPAADQFSVLMSSSNAYTIVIYDLAGKVLESVSGNGNSSTISTTGWSTGSYLVYVYQGETLQVAKLMVK